MTRSCENHRNAFHSCDGLIQPFPLFPMVWGWSNLSLISRPSAAGSNHTAMSLLLLKSNDLLVQSGCLFRYISKEKDTLLHKRGYSSVFHDIIFPFMRIASFPSLLVSIFRRLIRLFGKYRLSHLSEEQIIRSYLWQKNSSDHIGLSDWNRRMPVPRYAQ